MIMITYIQYIYIYIGRFPVGPPRLVEQPSRSCSICLFENLSCSCQEVALSDTLQEQCSQQKCCL